MSNESVNIVIYFHQLEILIVKLFFKTVVFAWLNPVKYSAKSEIVLVQKADSGYSAELYKFHVQRQIH